MAKFVLSVHQWSLKILSVINKIDKRVLPQVVGSTDLWSEFNFKDTNVPIPSLFVTVLNFCDYLYSNKFGIKLKNKTVR